MMTKTTTLLLATLMIAGCSNSQRSNDDTSRLCPAIMDTNLASLCAVNSREATVDITIGSDDDEVARETCDHIVKKLASLTSRISGAWQLQIFTPYRSDKHTASCKLH